MYDRDDVKKNTSSAAARACVCGYEETSQKKQTSTPKTTQPTLFSLYIYIRIKMALTIMASLAKVRRLFLLSVVVVSSSSYSSFMSRFKAHSSPEEEEEEEEMEEEKRLLV